MYFIDFREIRGTKLKIFTRKPILYVILLTLKSMIFLYIYFSEKIR